MSAVIEEEPADETLDDDVEKTEVKIRISAFGKKEDQIESEQARKELQEVKIKSHMNRSAHVRMRQEPYNQLKCLSPLY